eukprot:CAMPEP_0117021922 /NCGR_PEP_ID=MMETSP0472-20121206/16528_1 /TAXON_ID=693140 ORGANISM="Tiarina fusus, Strain LIS" /NCGR_SAMPLE_ID=MMETSP0472 /ASSEMBLY_ACC=CAM_ASM_000603 /LENGTH=186 /DNA_ID=CAMNT_0004727627 /DNA_START=361 /DNA_END=917 /DNA_ORIENTATION=+
MTNPDTKETILLDILHPGEIFGEIPFILGLASNVSYETTEESVIIPIPRTTVEQMIQDNSEFAVSLYKLLAKTIFTRLFKLNFCDQGEILGEKLAAVAPLLDAKQLPMTKSPFSSPVVLRKDLKRVNAAVRNSLPAPEVNSLSVKTNATKNRSPSFSNLNELKADNMEKRDSWVSVSKRASPTVPR